MHQFMIALIQLGATLKRQYSGLPMDVSTMVDRITEHGITDSILERGGKICSQTMNRLLRIRFVNLVVDAGKVHTLKSVVCLLSNPHSVDPPVLLELYENLDASKSAYQELFMTLFAEIASKDLILCSVIIDNLPAQSYGLDTSVTY
jgi:hypothetical protein